MREINILAGTKTDRFIPLEVLPIRVVSRDSRASSAVFALNPVRLNLNAKPEDAAGAAGQAHPAGRAARSPPAPAETLPPPRTKMKIAESSDVGLCSTRANNMQIRPECKHPNPRVRTPDAGSVARHTIDKSKGVALGALAVAERRPKATSLHGLRLRADQGNTSGDDRTRQRRAYRKESARKRPGG